MLLISNFDLLFLGISVAGTLILGFFIYFNNRESITNRTFLKFSLVTACWGVFNYLNYNVTDENLVLLFIRLVMFFAVFQAFYFCKLMFVFPEVEKIIRKKIENIVFFVVCAVAGLTITPFVFSSIEKKMGGLVYQPKAEFGIIVFAITTISLVVAGFYFLLDKHNKASNDTEKKQFKLLFMGTISMFSLIIFFNLFMTNIFNNTSFIPYGASFVLPFVILTSYAIHKHKLFNLKVASVGFVAFILTVFSIFNVMYAEGSSQITLNITFFLGILIGSITLIKTILHEVEQKEELAKLNSNLQELLNQRESLVHLVTHKVKGSFTRSKYIFAGILDGTFGDASKEIKKRAQQGLDSDNTGIKTVDLVLNAANLAQGTIKYDIKKISLKELVENTIEEKTPSALAKELKLIKEIPEGEFMVNGDSFWLKEAVNNLVENSIRYTREGSITVGLKTENGKVLFYVKDTGVGITDEDKKNLFKEGGRGKDSVKMNIDSTGYGLYSVKLIMEAHEGRVWGESDGPGTGSTFFVEIDAA